MTWEYIVRIGPRGIGTGRINDWLNRVGAEGWELVAADEGVYYFKRPKESK